MANLQIVYPKTRTTRAVFKSDKTGLVPAGREEIFFETSIDLDYLFTLARRAANNKNNSATMGPLKVKILERRPLKD